MDILIFFLYWIAAIVWGCILGVLCEYAAAYFSFARTLYKHPEDGVCCCGAHIDDHSVFDNHAVKTQREWFIECNKPKFM